MFKYKLDNQKMSKNNLEKLKNLQKEYMEMQKQYMDISLKIYNHNIILDKITSTLTYKSLYTFSLKYPNAILVIENPDSKYIEENYDKLKLFKDNNEYECSIQPILNFKGIVANEKFIALYVTEKPDLDMFDVNISEAQRHFVHGKNILNISEQIKHSSNKMQLSMEHNLFGYWIDDIYFQKHNWKSIYKADKNYINVFCLHSGVDKNDIILNPHY